MYCMYVHSQSLCELVKIWYLACVLCLPCTQMAEKVERLQKELDQSREDQERLNSDVTALRFDKQSLETQVLKAEVRRHT